MRVLISGPSLQDHGGVANYYRAVFPLLNRTGDAVCHYLAIGATEAAGRVLHYALDPYRLSSTIRTFHPDLVHVNPSLNAKSLIRDGLFVQIAKQRKLPVVVFLRGWSEQTEQRIDRYWKKLFRSTFERADAFVVLGSRFRDRLKDWGIEAPVRCAATVVEDDLLRGFSIGRKLEELRAAAVLRLLYLSRVERKKGIFETLEAVKLLADRGCRVELTVAGDGSALASVKDWVRSRQAPVRCVGYLAGSRKAQALASHHVFCFPSHWGEGMPNAVLEAMAFGMPVVARPVGGLADILSDCTGPVLKSGDPLEVASAVESLILDRGKAVEIGGSNHRTAQRYLASRAAEELLEIYRTASTRKYEER